MSRDLTCTLLSDDEFKSKSKFEKYIELIINYFLEISKKNI
jgi:hypothetical protein